jgi:hypothetical protein
LGKDLSVYVRLVCRLYAWHQIPIQRGIYELCVALQLLETTRLTVEDVAVHSGFGRHPFCANISPALSGRRQSPTGEASGSQLKL